MTDRIDELHCREASRKLGENNDCTVRAIAVATQLPYMDIHRYLAEECGREMGKGLHWLQYIPAVRALGFRVEELDGPEYRYSSHLVDGSWYFSWKTGREIYRQPHWRSSRRMVAPGEDYQSATVTALAKELKTGTYLVIVQGHVLCLRSGIVHDWTRGRRHRIKAVFRVSTP